MKKIFISLIILIFAFVKCGQIKEMKQFSKCQFRYKKIENINLNGINVQDVNSLENLNFMKIAKLTQDLLTGNDINLKFNYLLEVKNPNNKKASINGLEWIAFVDDKKLVEGEIDKPIEVEANKTKIIPIEINVNLLDVFSKDIGKSILNYGFNLVDKNGNPARVTLKVKPIILVAGIPIKYPSYFTLEKDFKL